MDQRNIKKWDNDLEDMKIKAEIDQISEKIDQIVKSLEHNDPVAKTKINYGQRPHPQGGEACEVTL